jgi:hypothetical protein
MILELNLNGALKQFCHRGAKAQRGTKKLWLLRAPVTNLD